MPEGQVFGFPRPYSVAKIVVAYGIDSRIIVDTEDFSEDLESSLGSEPNNVVILEVEDIEQAEDLVTLHLSQLDAVTTIILVDTGINQLRSGHILGMEQQIQQDLDVDVVDWGIVVD